MPKAKHSLMRSRPAMERVFWIHEQIKGGNFPNSVSVAKHFGVSDKTILRDIEFLRDRWELPIEWDFFRKGYFYSKPVTKIPGLAVSEQDMFALLVADKVIAQYQGTPFQRPLRMAFERLTGQLDTDERYMLEDLGEMVSFRPVAPEDTDVELFESVTKALRERRVLKFQYRKHAQRAVRSRNVHPHHLAWRDGRWYLRKQQSQYGERDVFKVVFEVDRQKEDGMRYAVWSRNFTPTLNEKSSFRKFLRGWFGRDLTSAELQEFDTETLLGNLFRTFVRRHATSLLGIC
jgi:hypothetical protein